MTLLHMTLLIILGTILGVYLCPIAVRKFAEKRIRRIGLGISKRAHLEALTELRTVEFHKFRTIVTGEFVVISVDPFVKEDEQDLRWFAGALEHHAAHPIGRAISRLAARGNVSDVLELPQGIAGSVDRHPVRVGKPHWLGHLSCMAGPRTVAVEVDARTMGTITVADELAPTIRQHLRQFEVLGLTPCLLSYEPTHVAKELAKRAGIDTATPVVPAETLEAATLRLNERADGAALASDTVTIGNAHPFDVVIRSVRTAKKVRSQILVSQVAVALLGIAGILAAAWVL